MLKPIVSMNQMAMNESIATTCCYKWNGNEITGSATVLHGGKIEVNKKIGYYYPGTKAPTEKVGFVVSDGWLNVPCIPTGANYTFVADATHLPYKSGGDWYTVAGDPITEFGSHIVLDGWTFNVAPKDYYTAYVKEKKLNHVGSTSAHYQWTSGNNWLADHEAVQYSS